MQTSQSAVQQTIPAMRWLLLAAGLLVFIAGFQLFILTEQTDRFFAWTIKPSLTAAFLGAAYWSSCLLEIVAARESSWHRARIAVPAVLVFTSLTLVATLLHIERLHFASTDPITLAATWTWLAIYALVPVAMLIVLVLQNRAPGEPPAPGPPLEPWLRAVFGVQAAIMVILGIVMFLAPQTVLPIWPWTLTPLTARAVAAWLIGLGIAAAQESWENDYTRIRPALLSSVLFGVLELIALVRYFGDAAAGGASLWLYLLFIISLLAVGLYGWRRSMAR